MRSSDLVPIQHCCCTKTGTASSLFSKWGPIRFHSVDVSAHVTVLMSSRSTYCHTPVLQYDSNILRASWLVRDDVKRVKPNRIYGCFVCCCLPKFPTYSDHACGMTTVARGCQEGDYKYRWDNKQTPESAEWTSPVTTTDYGDTSAMTLHSTCISIVAGREKLFAMLAPS